MMKRTGLVIITSLLSACTLAPMRDDIVREQIEAEIAGALTSSAGGAAKPIEQPLLPPIAIELPKVEQEEPRFDLSVVNAPAVQVFMAIVNGTPYNMLVGPEVTGNITIELKDVTVKEALEAIRDLYGYEFEIKGKRITIQPNTLKTRIFQVNYLASRRQGATDLRVMSSAIAGTMGASNVTTPSVGGQPLPAGAGYGQPPQSALTTRVQTQTEADFWRDLQTALTTFVQGEGRQVVINSMSGVVVVRGYPAELRAVEQYLRATQFIVERQVMLEAKILEVRLHEQYQTGINWSSFGKFIHRSESGLSLSVAAPNSQLNPFGTGPLSAPGVTALAGLGGTIATTALGNGFVGLAFQTANFAALLNFLETQGTVSVLSSPRIATLNNQKAVLKVGTDELFVTNVTTTTTSTQAGTTATPSLTLQPYFSGISLDVTPQISDDGDIILHIHPAVSNVVEKEKVVDLGTLGQFKLPLATSSVNETDSIVRVKDGQIVAIGGLMSQEQTSDRSGLPGALASPSAILLGQRGAFHSKRELVILLKPTIIRDAQSWNRDLEESRVRLQGGAAEVKRP